MELKLSVVFQGVHRWYMFLVQVWVRSLTAFFVFYDSGLSRG